MCLLSRISSRFSYTQFQPYWHWVDFLSFYYYFFLFLWVYRVWVVLDFFMICFFFHFSPSNHWKTGVGKEPAREQKRMNSFWLNCRPFATEFCCIKLIIAFFEFTTFMPKEQKKTSTENCPKKWISCVLSAFLVKLLLNRILKLLLFLPFSSHYRQKQKSTISM